MSNIWMSNSYQQTINKMKSAKLPLLPVNKLGIAIKTKASHNKQASGIAKGNVCKFCKAEHQLLVFFAHFSGC